VRICLCLLLLLGFAATTFAQPTPLDELKTFLLAWRQAKTTGTYVAGADIIADGKVDQADATEAIWRYLFAIAPKVATIRGTVYLPDGKTTAPGAVVSVAGGGAQAPQTQADTSGNFTLANVPVAFLSVPDTVVIVAKITPVVGDVLYAWVTVQVWPGGTTTDVKLVASENPPPGE